MNPVVLVAATITQVMEELKPTPPVKGPPLPSKLGIGWPKGKLSEELARAKPGLRF